MMDLSGDSGSFGKDEYDYDYDDHKDRPHHGLYYAFDLILFIMYCLVFVLGGLGNGAVIWVTGFRLKKSINAIWFLNLAVSDFLFVVFLPLTVTDEVMGGRWPFGSFMCKLNYSVDILTMYTSAYVLVAISVDRCVAVVWPVWAQNHRSVRKASYASLGVWALSLTLSTPGFILIDTRTFQNSTISYCYINPSNDEGPLAEVEQRRHQIWAWDLSRLLLGLVVPLSIIVSCLAVVWRKNSLAGSHLGHPLKITAAVVTAYFLCWAPFHIMTFIPKHSISEMAMLFIAVSLMLLSRCVNPLLYVLMGQGKGKGCKPVLKVLESVFAEEEPGSNPPATFSLSDAE